MVGPLEAASRPSLVDMAQAYFRGKVLCAAVRLGIADALGDGNKSVDDLAAATNSNADGLHRLLRALASIGVVEETAPSRFKLTPFGEPLQRNAPHSVWASIVFWADLLADAWTYLPECVQAGTNSGGAAAMAKAGTKSRWVTAPDARAIFHAVFAEPTPDQMAPVARAYDFSRSSVVADLGGGGGALLAAILIANPQVHGIFVDRQEAVDGAAPKFAAAGLAGRCQFVSGDLLEAVPSGPDIFVMSSVLHGYDDANAEQILHKCHMAMTPRSRLLVIEVVLPSRVCTSDPELEKVLMADLNMLVATGGRERTEAEWASLFTAAAFGLRQIIPISGFPSSIIEVSPCSGC